MTDSATAGRRYNGISAAARRDQRRGQFLDAALTVVARDGVAAMSMRALCAESGLHARYFREIFDSVDEVMNAAADEVASDIARDVSEAIAQVPREAPNAVIARTRAAVRAAFDVVNADPRRIALLTSADSVPGLAARREQLIDLLATVMAMQAAEMLDDPPAPEDALLAARLTAMGAVSLLTASAAGRVEASGAAIEETIVAAILGSQGIAETLRQVRSMATDS
ncbi:TetR/AcrR family transcriptional regulator [Gordonia sp. X0973]|uniref:TetR/AcrR family transcriptional regulator n=1 Tax=Gordonia sp. X0973 TaxID=2742602 RepID=UPI000F527BF1|nr:TetR/AcrR family transcriptional regulator [Gordonia sp. X0973]QKT07795.1 TetR/AcrR family transcriptional regulator [Gordonia sp. X0973]